MNRNIAILGAGNIGQSIARGLLESDFIKTKQLFLTRRKTDLLDSFSKQGVKVSKHNKDAIEFAEICIIAVEPKQIDTLLEEIRDDLNDKHILISVATAVSIKRIKEICQKKIAVVRAMPNTAIAIRESITCLSAKQEDKNALQRANRIFEKLGQTLIITEDKMTSATALTACGIAFFLRAIRAASQGGIEIGFHAEEALKMAAQTARGAASLLLSFSNHPEHEIDRVTTPRGCTIAGLNKMEHAGFSSALIQGIVTSAIQAEGLYQDSD